MDVMYALVVILATLLICLVIKKISTNTSNFPPGPWSLPFFGSFFHTTPLRHLKVPLFQQKYGNVLGFYLGSFPVVFVSGLHLIKDVMIDRSKVFGGRPNILTVRLRVGENREGIASTSFGPKWSAHRKRFNLAVRGMSFNNKGTAEMVTEELPYFIEKLDEIANSNSMVEPTDAFEYAVLNVLAYFVFGNRYSYGDPKFTELFDQNKKHFDKLAALYDFGYVLVSTFPILEKYWLPKQARELRECCRNVQDFIAAEIKYHRDTIDYNNPRDLIDYYLMELKTGDTELHSEEGLQMTIFDIFQAGTETTATTLRWAVLYMANNPKIQDKVYREILEILGPEKHPSYEDKIKMPYTEATILEVQRIANVAPFGLLHTSTKQSQLGGYDIPENTIIAPNYSSIHHSTDYWVNPLTFDPNHFIDPDGKVGVREAFMPFGGGIRMCMGFNIAKQELFILFTAMMQRYAFSPPDGVDTLPESSRDSSTLQPEPYKVKMQSRFK